MYNIAIVGINACTCTYAFVCRTHKIVGISTVSRLEHRVAQTRELECTKRVLPQVIQRGKC